MPTRLAVILLFPLVLVLTLSPALVAAERPLPGETSIRADELKRDVEFLASDECAGRKTAGGVLETKVAEYVEAGWKRLAAQPGGVDGTYRQPWRYRSWQELGFLRPPVDPVPAGRFGVNPNQSGVAFAPSGEPVSTEPLPELPTLVGEGPNTLNLIARFPGTDPALSDQFVVVGAHIDHLGQSSYGGNKIYRGADDNASGSAAVMAICRALTSARDSGKGPKRSVLAILFAGEEAGLLGSQYFVGKPTVPLASIYAMVNCDMLGRQGSSQLSCWDVGKPGAGNLFHELHDLEGLGFTRFDHDIQQYSGSSDQAPFMRKGIPIIFFFEGFSPGGGLNPDYHRTTDTPDKMDFDKLERAARVVFRHVITAAGHP